uniref:IPT/TIG domain-containing protein n=1 Tax=Candidatus Methanogaster sp. ANME-2c ERB4 TaxID=2759911 RepID=A0A7G9YG97_9EURY|nr:hypothetical protein LBHKAHFG_00012 [Methanosarcinales archaeon ANME-2c ERB4]
MKRTRILYGLTILVAVLSISIALAIVPPPPANQDLGIYDTVYGGFAEDECRACHSSGVPDAHHMLVPNEGYNCTDCHKLGPSGGIDSPIRDCVKCHLASPHHEADEALDRHCSYCHGSLVDDYDDGHYIPTYNSSLITPDTSYNWKNETTGKKWGGCEACHEANTTPVSGATIHDNYVTHHNIWPGDNEKCSVCHDMVAGANLTIRKCEDCHGVKSLHNIQYDYATTEGELGYGHIGDSWDCMGCHAWYEAASDAPRTGPITPSIDEISHGKLVAGKETVVTITGNNFKNTVNGIYYTSDVVIVTGVETTTLTPDYITASQIVVTIPEMAEGTYGLRVAKSDMKSKMVPIVVASQVTIDSAKIRGATVIVRGSGFGDELYDESLGVTIACEGNDLESSISSWDSTRIVVKCLTAAAGDEVTVTTLYGSDSATIVGSRIR